MKLMLLLLTTAILQGSACELGVIYEIETDRLSIAADPGITWRVVDRDRLLVTARRSGNIYLTREFE